MTARTALTPTVITRNGVAPVAFANSDNVNGNSCPNDPNTWIEVSNTDSVSRNVTVKPSRQVDGQTVTGTAHTVAAAAQLRLGPFPTSDYGTSLQINTDAALLKIAAYTLG